MKNMINFIEDRSIIEISGNDSHDFLQGLISNDINKIKEFGLIYALMLSPKGRFLYDLFIFQKDSSIFLDVLDSRADEIVKKLSFYKLKKDVKIAKNTELSIYCDIDNIVSNEHQKYAFTDPRSDKMGRRIYRPESEMEDSEIAKNQDYYEFTRIKNKIPESEKDLNYNKSIPIEYGLDKFNAIDYKKGCYVGQELTARTHYLGQVRKKIFLHRATDSTGLEKNTGILQNNKNIGIVLSSVKYNNILYGLIFVKINNEESFDKNYLTANNIKIEILD